MKLKDLKDIGSGVKWNLVTELNWIFAFQVDYIVVRGLQILSNTPIRCSSKPVKIDYFLF